MKIHFRKDKVVVIEMSWKLFRVIPFVLCLGQVLSTLPKFIDSFPVDGQEPDRNFWFLAIGFTFYLLFLMASLWMLFRKYPGDRALETGSEMTS